MLGMLACCDGGGRVPAEVWEAGVCVNRECFVFLVSTNKNVGLLFFELATDCLALCGQSKRFLEHVLGQFFSAWSMFRLLCDHVLQLHGGLFSGLQVVWARGQHDHNDNNDGDTHARFVTRWPG